MPDGTYVKNVPRAAISTVCPPPAATYNDVELMRTFENGLASDNLLPDPASGRIPVARIQAHVEDLTRAGKIKARPMVEAGNTMETNMDKLIENDTELYSKIQQEYCFLEQRYRYALKTFLQKATSRNTADNAEAMRMLENTKRLNIRLNSLLEITNYLSQSRVEIVNSNKTQINLSNTAINQRMSRLQENYRLLSSDNAILKTQREMVRFTEEKNNYTANQIMIWTFLNAAALGTIFYVYRS